MNDMLECDAAIEAVIATYSEKQILFNVGINLKSVKNALVDFIYFLLLKVNRFISKIVNVMLCFFNKVHQKILNRTKKDFLKILISIFNLCD